MSLLNGQYRVEFPVVQKLTETGFETVGVNTNFNGNYSGSPEKAIYQAPPGTFVFISALQFAITDTGTFANTDYGNIVGGLTNGIATEVIQNGVTITNPAATINNNAELFGVDSQAAIVEYASNFRTLVARFNFKTAVALNGNTGDKVQVSLSDDFTGLITHEFTVYGVV